MTTPTAAVKTRTRVSTVRASRPFSRREMLPGRLFSIKSANSRVSRSPNAAPPNASGMLSSVSCTINRMWEAPRALRIANSRRRASPRTNCRLARLARQQKHETGRSQQQQDRLEIGAVQGAGQWRNLRATAGNDRRDLGLGLRQGHAGMQTRDGSSRGAQVGDNQLDIANSQEEIGGKHAGDEVWLTV